MPKILRDFIRTGQSANGFGYFQGDKLAVKIASTMGKRQIRMFERYGLVPSAFFAYLKERGIIPMNSDTSREAIGRTTDDLLEFLWACPDRNDGARDAAEYLRKLILVSLHPKLKSAFIGQDRLWKRIEDARKGVTGPGFEK